MFTKNEYICFAKKSWQKFFWTQIVKLWNQIKIKKAIYVWIYLRLIRNEIQRIQKIFEHEFEKKIH